MAKRSLGTLTVDLLAKTGGFTAGMTKAERAVDNFAKKANSAMDTLKGFAKVALPAIAMKQVVDYADNWSDLNSRLKASLGSAELTKAVMSELAITARGTFSSLEQTAESFISNSTALTEMGYSYKTQLELSDALNNALVVSGTKGRDAESVMSALSRSFAMGELSGRRLITVLQQGGRITEALAKEMGVATFELQELGSKGLITTDRMIKALTSEMETLRAEADEMPATVGDAFTLLNNELLAFIGGADEATGASGVFAESLIWMADKAHDLNKSFSSGQFGKELEAMNVQLQYFYKSFQNTFDSLIEFSALAGREISARFNIGLDTILESFRDLPSNLATFLRIMEQEIEYFTEYAVLNLKKMASFLDPRQLFGEEDLSSFYDRELEFIAKARESATRNILQEHIAVKESTQRLREEGQKLREEFGKTNDILNTVGASLGFVADELENVAKGKSYEEILGTFDKLQRVTNDYKKILEEIENSTSSLSEKQHLVTLATQEYEKTLARLKNTNPYLELKTQLNNVTRVEQEHLKLVQEIELANISLSEKTELLALAQEKYNKALKSARGRSFEDILGGYDETQRALNDYTKAIDEINEANLTTEERTYLLALAQEKLNETLGDGKSYWEQWLEGAENSLTNFNELSKSVIDNFTSSFGNAFESVVMHTSSFKTATQEMLTSIVSSTVRAVGEMIAQYLALQAVQAMTAGFGGGGFGVAIGGLVGMAHDGIREVPQTGTWLLQKGEQVVSAKTSKKLDEMLQETNNYDNRRNYNVQQQIVVQGTVDNRTASQIALETDRKLKLANMRLG